MGELKFAGIIKKILSQLIITSFGLQGTTDEYPALPSRAGINYLHVPVNHVQPH